MAECSVRIFSARWLGGLKACAAAATCSAGTVDDDAGLGGASEEAGAGASKDCPHATQNLAAGLANVPHCGQRTSIAAPHCSQNRAPDGLSAPQAGQRIAPPFRFHGLGQIDRTAKRSRKEILRTPLTPL